MPVISPCGCCGGGVCCCCCIEGPAGHFCCDAYYGPYATTGSCIGNCPTSFGQPDPCRYIYPFTIHVDCKNADAGMCTLAITPFANPFSEACHCAFGGVCEFFGPPGFDIAGGFGDTTGCPTNVCACT